MKPSAPRRFRSFQLVGINGEVEVMTVPRLMAEQGVDRPTACNAGTYTLSGHVADQAGYVAGLHG